MIAVYYSVHIITLLGVGYWLYRQRPDSFFWPALILKICAGVVLGLLYRFHYQSGDTLLFFQDAMFLSKKCFESPVDYLQFLWNDTGSPWLTDLTYSQYRSLFFVKAISLVAIFTFQQYGLAAVWCSFLSFLGCWLLYRTLSVRWPEGRVAAAISFLFFPSFVLWSSGLIKESVAVAGLMALTAVLLRALWGNARPAEVFLFVFSGWIVWGLKYYWLAVWLPVAIALVVHQASKVKARSGMQVAVALASAAIVLVVVSRVHPNFDFNYLPAVIVENNRAYTASGGTDHAIVFADLEPDWFSLARHAPWAAFSGMFRPLPGESFNFLSLIFSLENGVVLLLTLWSLFRWGKTRQVNSWMIAVLLYTVVLALLLALSTPNFGSLARYKTGFMPFFVYLILFNHPVAQALQRRLKFL